MEGFFSDLGVVMIGAAFFSWLTVRLRQPIIIGYILCGVIFGPWGLKLVHNVDFVDSVSRLGIIFLLFLAGIVLHPRHLIRSFRQTMVSTLLGCLFPFIIAFVFSLSWGFSLKDSLLAGAALMFSSTILVIKLLPTTTLHQERMGEICISVLVAQDVIAILILTLMHSSEGTAGISPVFFLIVIKAIAIFALAAVIEQYVLRKAFKRVEAFHETLFITGIAWCLGISILSQAAGLSYEIGAFCAGLALARNRISLFISEKLKPLRDFFIVLFFFAIGARLDLFVLREVILPALILAAACAIFKPPLMSYSMRVSGIDAAKAKEAGLRLGQSSEFALIIAAVAAQTGFTGSRVSYFIQCTAIITMVVSSYIVVNRLETPLAAAEHLRRD